MSAAPMWSATLPAGPRGTIADVPGVTVGHCTLDAGDVQTGVTVVKPHPGDLYRSKVPAGAAVINGFGKSVGLVQVDELGTLETPIALTNTFGVAALAHAQIRAAIAANPQIGRDWPTVNPLVFQCNDGYLNDIHACAVTAEHYDAACRAASRDVSRGAVGGRERDVLRLPALRDRTPRHESRLFASRPGNPGRPTWVARSAGIDRDALRRHRGGARRTLASCCWTAQLFPVPQGRQSATHAHS
ncbi:L-aminopeptidase/D-esterase [Burkholderia dolosa AU0158]|nr:L-aminopeptidase/D-esterase [Burkholderia dolosa AU0158]